MRVVVQRVSHASVSIEGKTISAIGHGMLVLAGFESTDTTEDIDWITAKVCKLRIFSDENGVMNLSIADIAGEVMVVSQFTLYASTKKGNRPSYVKAADPSISVPLYEQFLNALEQNLPKKIASGKFGAMMDVSIINTGPVTILIDSRNRE